MFRQILPISALLLGSAFLLFAGGINSLILPVRGSAEGFSAFSLGLLGTGWAVGYVSGCVYTPMLVARVGHIRSFSVMAAIAALVILASLIFLTPWAWIPLRAISGFCFAGAAMIVESWLNERAEPNTRGRIFGTYTMINLFASTGGQMTLTLGDSNGYLFFVLGAMFYCLALIPTAITSSETPKPLVSVKLNIRALWKNSPIAVFGVVMVGISNSAFGTLSAVYADRIGLVLASIALFASLPILAGAIAQVPVGIFSDRIDRRRVLIGIAAVAICADIAFLVLQPESRMINIALACVFGAAVFSMYPVIVAHASDHAEPGTYIQISGGLLLLYGVGGMAGPLIAGVAMSLVGPLGLFATTLVAHIPIVLFALWRISKRAPVAQEAKIDFVPSPMARASTPETMAMAGESARGGVKPQADPPEDRGGEAV
ncbi:MAG TPA: MFS transporter [Thermohalobaculum sp.]|nr:MFS transporter [Thermohalobaculum sp.]